MNIYLVVREHADKSGYEICRAYDSQDRAEQDIKLTEGDYGMRYELKHTELIIIGDLLRATGANGQLEPVQ